MSAPEAAGGLPALAQPVAAPLTTQFMARIGNAVSPVDEVHGFRYFDDRDLIGFVDGRTPGTRQ